MKGVLATGCPSGARALTPAPRDLVPRGRVDPPLAGLCEGGLAPTPCHSPHCSDADFQARGQVLCHKLAVTTLIVIHDVLPWEACFWVEGMQPVRGQRGLVL